MNLDISLIIKGVHFAHQTTLSCQTRHSVDYACFYVKLTVEVEC